MDGRDLGTWLASNCWAIPFREYTGEVARDAANTAKAAKLGIWSSSFETPWEWRAAH